MNLIAGVLGLVPGVAWAQATQPNGMQLIPDSGIIGNCSFITGEFHYECFPLYLGFLIQVAFAFGVGTCLLQFVIGGYEWAISSVENDTTGAKKRMRHAVTGLIVAILAFLIVDTIVINLLSGPSAL